MNIRVEKNLITKGKETYYKGIFNVNIKLTIESEEPKEEYESKEEGKLELVSKTPSKVTIIADSLGTAESRMTLPKYVFNSIYSIIEPYKLKFHKKVDCDSYNLDEDNLTYPFNIYPFTLICTIEDVELTEKELIYQIELLSDMIEANSDLIAGS